MGITSNLIDVIDQLGVAEGEIDNIAEAALRDLADHVALDMTAQWPRFGGARPPSERSNSTRVPDRKGRPHSGELWKAQQRGKLDFFVLNPAPYTSFVHIDKGHPNGLAADLLPEIVSEVAAAPLDFISDRVFDAITGGE